MTKAENVFQNILSELMKEEENVIPGNMMRADGIKYKTKVFAFFHQEKMGLRLGKDFDPEPHGITRFEYLSPFKNKPPMKAWFMIEEEFASKWKDLTRIAFEKMRSEIG